MSNGSIIITGILRNGKLQSKEVICIEIESFLEAATDVDNMVASLSHGLISEVFVWAVQRSLFYSFVT